MFKNISYIEESRFEHRFWLQILGDHSRFIYSGLAPKEIELINRARNFILVFDTLLNRARGVMDSASWMAFAGEVLPQVEALRAFKLDILKRSLCNKVEIALSPTFFNHMLNELDEYLRNLSFLVQGRAVPVRNPVHHNLLWVSDAEGHAGAVYCRLDESQTRSRMTAKTYLELWSKKYGETVEYAGFLRTGMPMFPTLGQFDKDVACEMFKFKDFLEELKVNVLEAKTVGTLPALVPDHMAREECYFLHRLHQSDPQNVPAPECDPTRPRINQ